MQLAKRYFGDLKKDKDNYEKFFYSFIIDSISS